ncbi:LysR substrate-binding domain-containing protein [Paracidovorax citrulli]
MIRYFRTFLVAAETASFSAAASRLALTQSAVSTQIRRLEEELGCNLFDRTGKSVALSLHGRRLLPEAVRFVELYETMRGQAAHATELGPIALGAVSTVQGTLLPRALARFRHEFAQTQVSILPGMSTQLLTMMDARELDVAVMIRPRLGIPAELKWITLIEERFAAIAPRDVPGDLRTVLAATPFIRYNRHSAGGHLVDRYLKRHRLWVQEAMELDEPAVILSLVEEGLGCAIIPAVLVPLAEAANVRVVPMPGRPIHREVGVLARSGALAHGPTAALVRAFATEARRWRARSPLERPAADTRATPAAPR